MEDYHDLDILNLSARTYNVLRRAGYDTIESVQDARDEDKLYRIRGIGMRALKEITQELKEWEKAVMSDVL